MTPTLTYLLKVMICSGLFISLYMLAFHKKVQYSICRAYLMATMALSVIIPAMNVPLYKGEPVEMLNDIQVNITRSSNNAMEETPTIATTDKVAELESVAETKPTATTTPATASKLKNVDWSQVVYWTIVAVMMIVIAKGLFSILKIRRKTVSKKLHNCHIVENESIGTPFTFFRTVYIGTNYSDSERQQILSHELSHAHHLHSVEKLAMSILRAMFWFNPFFWLAERRLEEVQEWQADSDAIGEGYEISKYQQTIFKQIFGCSPELASGMSNSFTKNRFIMMTKKLNGKCGLSVMVAIGIATGMFLSFGCTTKAYSSITNDNSNHLPPIDDELVKMINVDKYMKINGDDTIIYASPFNHLVFNVNAFFEDSYNEGVGTRHHFICKYDTTVEVYEDFTDPEKPIVAVACNNILADNDINSKRLKWVNKNTNIFYNGKRISFADYRNLTSNDYRIIYYISCVGNLSFVYVCKGEYDDYTSTTQCYSVIDTLGSKIPEVIECCSCYMGKMYSCMYNNRTSFNPDYTNVIVPYAKLFLNGEPFDYDIWRKNKGARIKKMTLYRNAEAQRRFGEQYRCVLEVTNGLGTSITITKEGEQILFEVNDVIYKVDDFFNEKSQTNQYTFEDLKKKIQYCDKFNAKWNEKTTVHVIIKDESLKDLSFAIIKKLNDTYGNNIYTETDEWFE